MGVERGYNGQNGAEVSEEPQECGYCEVRQRSLAALRGLGQSLKRKDLSRGREVY